VLTAEDKAAIESRVRALEDATGIEAVTMVVGKCDTYPETVWKAFALGAAMSALAVAAGDAVRPDWTTSATLLSCLVAVLGAGAACALACVYVPSFARLFLRPARAAVEVAQYAKTQFLDRGLSATKERTAVLVLVALLERRVEIVADVGFGDFVSRAEWDAVIDIMGEHLRAGRTRDALIAGLDAIGELLAGKRIAARGANRFADGPIEGSDRA
jgi:putative membrane protein